MTSRQINCPAPLLEGPADARLAKLLVPAPYVVPKKKVKKKAAGTQKGLRRNMVLSDSLSDEFDAPSSHGNEEEEKSSPPSRRGRQEKEGRPIRGGRRVQEGKDPPFGLCNDGRR